MKYSICEKYTAADKMLNNIKQPPCTNQLYHTQRLRRRQQELDALKAGITPRQIQLTADQHRRAIEIDDSNWWLRWKYGQLLHRVFSNTAAAAEQYRLVLKCVPHFSAALVDLALIEGKNGNVETAAKLLEKAVKITPTNVTAQYNLAFAYATQHKTKRAIHSYSEVLKLQPSYAPAYINLAALFYRLGKIDRAEQIYQKGLLAAPDNSSLHYKLAMLLNEKGQIDEAKKELRAALEFDPNSLDARRAFQRLSAPNY
jgi:tetratricopeptide (TPR) repeat protein